MAWRNLIDLGIRIVAKFRTAVPPTSNLHFTYLYFLSKAREQRALRNSSRRKKKSWWEVKSRLVSFRTSPTFVGSPTLPVWIQLLGRDCYEHWVIITQPVYYKGCSAERAKEKWCMEEGMRFEPVMFFFGYTTLWATGCTEPSLNIILVSLPRFRISFFFLM